MNINALVLLLCLSIGGISESARILGIFPIGGISHYAPAEGILKALAARGHNVTVITSYPQKTPLPNFRDIDVSKIQGLAINSLSFDIVRTLLQKNVVNFFFLPNISRTYCEVAFNTPEVHDLLNEEFDLVITEIFGADCNVGFAWKFKAPLISVISSRATTWAYTRVGSPVNPAYMRQIHVNYPSPMNFWQRLINTWFYLFYLLGYEYLHNRYETDDMSRKYFGPEVPPVRDIVKSTSLVFVNSHFTIEAAHPMTPNFIEIAGIHVKKSKPLPTDIKKFMDEAKQGVVYFTLGSLVRTSTLPKEVIRAFRDAFAELPVKVMWKFELDLQDIPPNVYLSKWFPQSDILAHPNLKAYVTHGGQLGTIEAVHNGVPLVGIPMYYDQHGNIQNMVEKGAAVKLDMNELTKEKILAALKTVLFDKSYAENMKELSRKFKDRPMTPEETAVYWTEYVIRHKGARHLQTVAANMPWHQYLLLDVIAVIIIILLSIIFASYFVVKSVLRFVKNMFLSKSKTD